MCSAGISSTDTSKIMVMKPSSQDGMTTVAIFMDTHNAANFQSSEIVDDLEGAQSQLPVKSDLDESVEMREEFQEHGGFIGTVPSEDLYRNGIPAYSLLLYKPGSNPSMESCPADMNPLMLQILSNILSGSSDGKRVGEPTLGLPITPDAQPGLTSSVSKPYSPLTSVVEVAGPRESSPSIMGPTARMPLSDVTNTLIRQSHQGKHMPTTVPRGEFFMMSPVITNLEDHPRPTPTSVHVTFTQAGYLPAFIDKSHQQLHSDPSQQLSLTSSGEESQMTSPLKADQSATHGLGTSTMSKLSMPLLANCPVSGHEGCGGPMRESHNMKERRRRARIKDACNLMRQLVPGMSHKTDKATVFEFSARYIHFLKSFVGSNNDKDFLLKYNPY